MLIYESDDLLGVVVGKTQAATDFFGHSHAHLNVPIEANAVRCDPKGGWFPYIVQERSPAQSRRTGMRQFFKQKERVDEDVSFRMKLCRLLHALHGGDFRQHLAQQPRLVQQKKSLARMSLREHLGEFVTYPLLADLVNARGGLANRGKSRRIDAVCEAGGEAHGAKHTKLVFPEAQGGIADGAN